MSLRRSHRASAPALLAACLATLLAQPARAAIEIPQVPLQSGTTVPPNILFILDDSGSMAWDFMPGAFNNSGVPAMTPVDVRLTTYTRNQLYYNPNVIYRPWRNADGSFMADTNYNAVFSSDTLASGSTSNLYGSNRYFHVPKAGITNLADTRQYWRYELRTDGTIRRYELVASGPNWVWSNATNITSLTWNTSEGAVTRNAADEFANFANWYSYHRTRSKVAKAGTSYAFSDLPEGVRVGFDTIWQRNTYRIPVNQDQGLFRDNGGGFSYTNRSTWFSRLFNATASNGTPLRTALVRAGNYFSEEGATGPYGPANASGQLSCRQNFAILTTDGYWNSDNYGVNSDNTTGPTLTSTTGATYTYNPAAPYADTFAGTLADVAMEYWKRDLRAGTNGLANNVPTSSANPAFWQHMVTFGISIGLQGTLNPDTAEANILAGSQSWPNPLDAEDDHRIDDLLHASVNGRGKFVAATNPTEFTEGLRSALATIVERTSSSSNVAANSTALNDGTRIFQASYVGGRWTGELAAYPTTAAGVAATPSWRASEQVPLAAARNIVTWNGSSGANFPTTGQTTALGATVAAYIRGVRTGEMQFGGAFRDRQHLLGDIVNSSPAFVKDTNTVYVGANDGMLHAFNASTGAEVFAYVPGNINLAQLKTYADRDYPHHYFVDGPIVVSQRTQTSGNNYLVGALGRGGKGVFALNVTNPSTFGPTRVMWEHSATNHDLMGMVITRPIIAKLNNGQVGVIVANGPNSTGDRAVLYVLNISTGAVIAEIDTGVGSAAAPNGLMAPRAWDDDGDGDVDFVYAGDLQGNMWRFALTGATSTWDDASNRKILYTAFDAGGKRQPITGTPSIAADPTTFKTWVFFGTGRFLNNDDLIRANGTRNTDVQTWYGVIDDGATIAGRADLQQRSIIVLGNIAGEVVRGFEPPAPLPAGKKGWYLDFLTPPNPPGTAEGERMVGDSAVLGNVLLGASIIPAADPCEFGGRGFINAISAFSGTSIGQPFFDVDGDGAFGDDVISVGGGSVPVGGIDLGVAMPTTPTVIENLLVGGGSSGTTGSINVQNPANQGRISWREIVRD